METEKQEVVITEVDNVEVDNEELRKNFISAVKSMYDSAMENVGDLEVSPLGFRDMNALAIDENLKTHNINARGLRSPASLVSILQDDIKFNSVMVAMSRSRNMFDKFDKDNTPIDVVESWVVAVLIESSGILKTKSEGN